MIQGLKLADKDFKAVLDMFKNLTEGRRLTGMGENGKVLRSTN